MADPSALRALAERVEQAERCSLHLDLAVAQALGIEGDEFGIPEAYSASLDAAVGLVPEGWRVSQIGEWDDESLRRHGAFLAILMPAGRGDDLCAAFAGRCDHARSLALALTAAALRARAVTLENAT